MTDKAHASLIARHALRADALAGAPTIDSQFSGTSGNDVRNGTSDNDTFDMTAGGNDVVRGKDGNDWVSFGSAFTAKDRVDGGIGTDTLDLVGNYANLVFAAKSLANVEQIFLGGADFIYRLTLNDANVGIFQTLTVTSYGLRSGIRVDGSAETDGSFVFKAGTGNDVLIGGAQDDFFDLSHGGDDNVRGGAGDDAFYYGMAFTTKDKVDGGDGLDTITLSADYAAGLVLTGTVFKNIEKLSLLSGHDYKFSTANNLVAAGALFDVSANTLAKSDRIQFDGSKETDGRFQFDDGQGNDVFTGGAGDDTVYGTAGKNKFLGGAGNDTIYDGQGNDIIGGGAGADSLVMYGSGNDVVAGGAGDDYVWMGAGALTAADRIDGGTGNNQMFVLGDNHAPIVAKATTFSYIQSLTLYDDFSFSLTTADANIAKGATLNIEASALSSASPLTIDGSAEMDGSFRITAGGGDDVLIGGAKADFFVTYWGGNDTISGLGGNDGVQMEGAFTADDKIDGGAGNDSVILDGDYSTNVKLHMTTLKNVEVLVLNGGFENVITTVNGTVAAGKALTVDASGMWGVLTFNGAAETDGRFVIVGSSAGDNLTGGSKNDTITGNYGADVLTGRAGADKFVYNQSWESSSTGYDRIVGFDPSHDKIDLWMTVSNVHSLSEGTLNAATIDGDLQGALGGLAAAGAVVFTPDDGDLAGKTFVVVESFGNSGYTDGDLIIQLGKPVSTALTIDTFI